MNPTSLIPILMAMKNYYQNLHWKSHGENFYSDHKMFQKIYESLEAPLDTWAEKLIVIYGDKCIDPVRSSEGVVEWLKRWSMSENISQPEIDMQSVVNEIFAVMKKAGTLTMGANDFLMSLCNDRDRYLNWLKQRQSKSS